MPARYFPNLTLSGDTNLNQLELSPESGENTTSETYCGLFRYKRLLFGVNSASEQYQYEIQTALEGKEGQENISDDIIVHGKDQKEHDLRLKKVIVRLKERGLTLSAEKCQFSVDKLTFFGMVLSGKKRKEEEKVKAVKEAREPRTVSETRSFLGLVNYVAASYPTWQRSLSLYVALQSQEPLERKVNGGRPFRS